MKKAETIFRRANKGDLDQVIDLTVESFNGSNGRTFYESLFEISRSDYREIVRSIFLSNISNNEYDIQSYFVLEKKDELISCLAGWKEGEGGIESERLLPMMVIDHVGMDKWIEKSEVIKEIADLNIPRRPGSIQIENMFLKKEHRGTSAFFTIYFNTVEALFGRYPECDIVQSRFFTSNALAIRIAKHIGYEVTLESSFKTPLIEEYFPNEGMVMTELERSVFFNNKKFQDENE